MGWELGGLAVFVVDCDVEKPSTISGFRMLKFWLSMLL
jgi:hypothetical protein